MQRIIKNRAPQGGQLIVQLEIGTPKQPSDFPRLVTEAKIDTGNSVPVIDPTSKKVKVLVPAPLLLPVDLRANLQAFLQKSPGMIPYCGPDSAKYSTEGMIDAFWFEVRLRTDQGDYFPMIPWPVAGGFLPHRVNRPPLIGYGLWRQWRIVIEPPDGHFDVWAAEP